MPSSKRVKFDENTEFDVGSNDDTRSEVFLRNSLQKTCEIIVKTNRIQRDVKQARVAMEEDEFQEFSCQAFLDSPRPRLKTNDFISDGFQTDFRAGSIDRTTQAFCCKTTATSTQTLSDENGNSDV